MVGCDKKNWNFKIKNDNTVGFEKYQQVNFSVGERIDVKTGAFSMGCWGDNEESMSNFLSWDKSFLMFCSSKLRLSPFFMQK